MPFWGVGVMAVSAVVNFVVSRRLFNGGEETDSVALRADAWHLHRRIYLGGRHAGPTRDMARGIGGAWGEPTLV